MKKIYLSNFMKKYQTTFYLTLVLLPSIHNLTNTNKSHAMKKLPVTSTTTTTTPSTSTTTTSPLSSTTTTTTNLMSGVSKFGAKSRTRPQSSGLPSTTASTFTSATTTTISTTTNISTDTASTTTTHSSNLVSIPESASGSSTTKLTTYAKPSKLKIFKTSKSDSKTKEQTSSESTGGQGSAESSGEQTNTKPTTKSKLTNPFEKLGARPKTKPPSTSTETASGQANPKPTTKSKFTNPFEKLGARPKTNAPSTSTYTDTEKPDYTKYTIEFVTDEPPKPLPMSAKEQYHKDVPNKYVSSMLALDPNIDFDKYPKLTKFLIDYDNKNYTLEQAASNYSLPSPIDGPFRLTNMYTDMLRNTVENELQSNGVISKNTPTTEREDLVWLGVVKAILVKQEPPLKRGKSMFMKFSSHDKSQQETIIKKITNHLDDRITIDHIEPNLNHSKLPILNATLKSYILTEKDYKVFEFKMDNMLTQKLYGGYYDQLLETGILSRGFSDTKNTDLNTTAIVKDFLNIE